jgi:hypothetical protein
MIAAAKHVLSGGSIVFPAGGQAAARLADLTTSYHLALMGWVHSQLASRNGESGDIHSTETNHFMHDCEPDDLPGRSFDDRVTGKVLFAGSKRNPSGYGASQINKIVRVDLSIPWPRQDVAR